MLFNLCTHSLLLIIKHSISFLNGQNHLHPRHLRSHLQSNPHFHLKSLDHMPWTKNLMEMQVFLWHGSKRNYLTNVCFIENPIKNYHFPTNANIDDNYEQIISQDYELIYCRQYFLQSFFQNLHHVFHIHLIPHSGQNLFK